MFLTAIVITDGVSPYLPLVLEKLATHTDEVVVVSSASDDFVQALVCRYENARGFHHDLRDFADQRTYAQGKARPGWVVHIDSDEVPDPELLEALDGLRKVVSPPGVGAYAIRRHTIVWGRWLRYGGMYPDEKTRVMPWDTIWRGEVHEIPQVRGRVGVLPGYVDHFAADDPVFTWFVKAPRYLRFDVVKRRRPRWLPIFPLLVIVKPLWVCVKNVALRSAWRDGVPGIAAQLTGACYEVLLYLSLWHEEVDRRLERRGRTS